MLLLFIILYLLLTLAIGLWAARRVRSTKDFVVAGRRLPTYVVGAALFATWFGSETIMGSSSAFVEEGVMGLIEDPLGSVLAFLLVGIFFARPIYKLDIITFNDYYRLRYGKTVELLSAILTVPSYFGWIAAQLVAMAFILQVLIGLALVWGVLLCAAIVLIYTTTGGMWAVSITDFVQTVMIIIGLVFLTVKLVGYAGGLEAISEQTPPGFFRFWPEPTTKGWAEYLVAWMTLGLGGIPAQDIFQRTMAARSGRSARNGAFLASGLYLVVAVLPLLITLSGVFLHPDLAEGDTQLLLPQLVLREVGLPLQILFFGALLSAILSTTSGAILAPATILAENVLKPLLPPLTDLQLLKMMRGCVIIITIGSVGMTFFSNDIRELVASATTVLLVGLFVPLALGIYWKRMSNAGALAAILGGTLAWLVCFLLDTEFPPTLYGFATSLVCAVIASFLAPDQPPKGEG